MHQGKEDDKMMIIFDLHDFHENHKKERMFTIIVRDDHHDEEAKGVIVLEGGCDGAPGRRQVVKDQHHQH